jgi:hypothetical protein
MHRKHLVAAVAAVALAGTALGGPADAEDPAAKPKEHTLATGLISPLRAAVTLNGTKYVTQDFAGQLMRVRPGKDPKVVYASKGGAEVGAVSVRRGVVTFAESKSDADGNYLATRIKRISKKGKVSTLANLLRYEKRRNPDHGITYGVTDLRAGCAAKWRKSGLGPVKYKGLIDSHPYATTTTRRGTYVADAAMNAVVVVSRTGRVRTVAVLPPTRVRITKRIAKAFGAPLCTVGHTYRFESVPTDIEVGPRGKLYVSALGGGAGENLPVGAVYRVDPGSGHVEKLFSGLMGAVGVAVTRGGDVYASQLFGGSIVKVENGSKRLRTFVKTAMPAEVELVGGRLYATVNALAEGPEGKLVRFSR